MADKKIDLSGNTKPKEASVVEAKSTTQTASTLKNVESANGATPKLASTDNSPANVEQCLALMKERSKLPRLRFHRGAALRLKTGFSLSSS